MILFDLVCSQGHGFEAWFRDNDSFERLVAVGEIQCAICGDTKVKKALMAPKISSSKAAARHAAQDAAEQASEASRNADENKSEGSSSPAVASKPAALPSMTVQDTPGPLSHPQSVAVPEKVAEAMQMLRKVQTHIEQNFDHVGKRFAEEARKMHYGEAEKRSIYGEATKEDAEALTEEGIEVNQIPWLPNRNS